MNSHDQEALGLPSASGYTRLRMCPGSRALEAQCPPEPDTEESTSGTKIHAWLAGELKDEDLTMDELDTAQMCRQLEDEAIAHWERGGSDVGHTEMREVRLWLRDGFEPIYSGQPDLVMLGHFRALITDAKTGWMKQPPASINDQLQALAVLLKEEHPELEEITVGLTHPAGGMRVELCTYNEQALGYARQELMKALAASEQPDAPLNAGNHCTYCRAKSVCPKLHQETESLANMTIGTGDDRRDMLDNDTLGRLLDKCGAVEKMIGSIKAEAKRRLQAGEQIAFGHWEWSLKDGVEKRKITDAAKARELLPELTEAAFLDSCSLAVGKVEEAFRKATGAKKKEAVDTLNTRLLAAGAMVMQGASEPSLERVPLRIAQVKEAA